mmetsp:Transcript_11416/g.32141  ORF Transcript_11416/g.32141 Transcript_11416/m.32141 type:complete len:231 (+) Transcript_11416:190-882(+)
MGNAGNRCIECIERDGVKGGEQAPKPDFGVLVDDPVGLSIQTDVENFVNTNDATPAAKPTCADQVLVVDGNGLFAAGCGGQVREGHGVLERPDGGRYEGQFLAGKVHGVGKLVYPNGDVYEGEWHQNQAHGRGKFVHKDGSSYEGQWVQDRMEGKGQFCWSDGRSYEGEYREDQKEGYGTFKWPDGRRYEGRWRDGKQHGAGVYFTAKGERRQGEWEDGRRTRWLMKEQA